MTQCEKKTTVAIAHAAKVRGRLQHWNPRVGVADARVTERSDAIRRRKVAEKSAHSVRLSLITRRRHVVEC